ncbi:dihydrofolate reductase [Mucilaginibacter sp. 14171R-50]|uniref:dihydrofolate reductase family protein n=1 Tax=Mucilaginibacter sp. 14171R-50 TaxID=2703789 RepID=UPI00138D9DE5|nr:dihydrofolate reductase family protein [Mucilaginibacter sp. 14171R-50]QHS57255.1 dihydrofolate reductase [Mucilaginibacter sp. 14171R-50]
MRKIKVLAHISLDGVVQSPGGREDDSDFAHSGWSMQYADKQTGEGIVAAHGHNYDLLLGRRTYDVFAGYWPNAQSGAIADGFNAAKKYVATHRPESLEWGPVEDLGADIVEGLRALKAQDGPDLIVWGSVTVTSLLFAHGMVDEVVLFVYPVLLGSGKRFFTDSAEAWKLELINSTVGSSGVVTNIYKYAGALQI